MLDNAREIPRRGIFEGGDVTRGRPRATHRERPRMAASNDHTVVPLRPTPPPTTPLGIDELVARARAGNMTAWSMLYRATYPGVLRHVCALVGSRTMAEDLAQEAYARALSSIKSFNDRSSFTTWLHGVALNLVRDHWRSHERRERATAQLALVEAARELGSGDPDRARQGQLRVEMLYAILAELTDGLREVFVLRYIEQVSVHEAAEQLGLEPGAVRVRAHRARARVEARMREVGWAMPLPEERA